MKSSFKNVYNFLVLHQWTRTVDNCQILSFESCVMIGDENMCMYYQMSESNAMHHFWLLLLPLTIYMGLWGVGPTLHLGPDLRIPD